MCACERRRPCSCERPTCERPALDPLLGLRSSHTVPLFPSEAPFQAAVGDRRLSNRRLSSAFSLKECNVALRERWGRSWLRVLPRLQAEVLGSRHGDGVRAEELLEHAASN